MADRKQCDQYAAELAQRFEEFTKWAIEHWPLQESPLLQSDFEASRKELSSIVGARLGAAQDSTTPPAPQRQYVPVSPAPWP
jgi:hypothetical protein